MDGCCHIGSVGWDNSITEPQAGQEGGLAGQAQGCPWCSGPHSVGCPLPTTKPCTHESLDLPNLWIESLPLKLPWQGQFKCERKKEDAHGGGGLA